MADGFEQMVHAARSFFADLAQNNRKDWYEGQKARYADEIRKPAELFADLVAEDLTRALGQAFTPKVFRIHRDVRFSKDKTPYNTHLHILWSPAAGGPLAPSWFFGLAPDYFLLGLGVMDLKGEALTRWRAFADRRGDALKTALVRAAGEAGARISDWGPEPLKRVPKPYGPDHPHGDLLRRKAFAVTADMPVDWAETELVKAVGAQARRMRPVYDVLVDG